MSQHDFTSKNSSKTDTQDNKINVELPEQDLNDLPLSTEPSRISDYEFAFDIWLFKIKDQRAIFDGIYRDGLIQRLTQKGFYKRYRDKGYILIKEENNIIDEVEISMIKDVIFSSLQHMEESLSFTYNGIDVEVEPEKLRETFLRQSHLIFNDKFLEHLPNHTKPILKDTEKTCFIPFRNLIVEITKDKIDFLHYSNLKDCCIWKKHIKVFDFTYVGPENNHNSHFVKFIWNVANHDAKRYEAFISAIGYLLHNYGSPTKGQAVLCYDEEIIDLKTPQGGTGKGLFANAILQVRETVKIDGKKFHEGDKFCFQDVNESTQVVWFDEVKASLSFDRFNSILTDGWNIEKKHKPSFYIKPQDSPKLLICSNTILENEGSTRKRRQFILEFSSHYSKQNKTGNGEPIKQEHGCTFFSQEDWDTDEWNKFYSFMIDCVYWYLEAGLQPYKSTTFAFNRLKLTTSEEFYYWVMAQNFQPNQEYETKTVFHSYKSLYYPDDDSFKQRTFTEYLKRFARACEWEYVNRTSHGKSTFKFIE